MIYYYQGSLIVPQDLALIDLVMSSCLYTVEDWPESTLRLILKIFGKLTRDSLDHTNDNVALSACLCVNNWESEISLLYG